jgi:spore coat protein U domain-containing protein, fimbrial subunit CupE1/2/3/6
MSRRFLRKRRLVLTGILASACLLQSVDLPLAATTTSTFTVSITLAATCTINSASALNFGNQGILSANVDQTSTIQVTCTNTTPYNIGLDAGTGSGATVATRKMTSGGATVDYTLYSDSGRATVWGNTVGTDTLAGTGNGTGQNFTVYGRVPSQTTPAPGTYTDTVTVTVTY